MNLIECSLKPEAGIRIIKESKDGKESLYEPIDLSINLSYSDTNLRPVTIIFHSEDIRNPVGAGLTLPQAEDMVAALTAMIEIAKRNKLEKANKKEMDRLMNRL